MRYELLLQAQDPSTPFDPGPVEAALSARGLTGEPSGSRTWRLKNGEVEVRPLADGGRQVGLEVRVPLSEKLELIREAVVEGAAVAGEAKARLIDPQLGKEIAAKDEGLVADQYLRTAKYAGEMMGVPEAIYASIPPADDRLLKPGVKMVLAIVGVVLLLLFLIDRVL